VIDSAGILSLFDLHKTFNKMITIEISGLWAAVNPVINPFNPGGILETGHLISTG
jgi:hypothetical protein